MKQTPPKRPVPSHGAERKEQASARTTSLVLGCFLVGVAASTLWFYRATKPGPTAATSLHENAGSQGLSEGTRAILKRLDAPIEIRFYSLLSPANASDLLKTFVGRVNQLLSLYEQEGAGKIKVSRFTSLTESAQDALADGLKPLGLDKGEEYFLGAAVVLGNHKEALPQLSPEWEPAVQSDLSRAIARVLDASAPAKTPAATARIDPTVFEEVKRTFPNLESVSLEQGSQVLRDAAVKELKAALAETDIQAKEAEQRLTQAQSGGSDADKQAALKNLQQIQADQTQRLKQIAARSAAQVEALRRLKSGNR